jgi:lauroyl/myristoyl acyltransferase
MLVIKLKDFYFLSVVVLIKFAQLISSDKLKAGIVSTLGLLAYCFSTQKRRCAWHGIERAFGSDLELEEKRGILLGSFRSFWEDAFLILPSKGEKALVERAKVVGEELLSKALEKGNGVILLESNSFGGRLLAKQVLFWRGRAVYQVHSSNHLHGLRNDGVLMSRLRSSVLRPILESWEKRFVTEIIHVSETGSLGFTRVLLQRLKQNCIVCCAGDGNQGYKRVTLPFLNQTRSFATGMFSLAKVSGSPVLPLFCYRTEQGDAKVVLGPTIDPGEKREKRLQEDLSVFAESLENHIRKAPDQYRNWHFSG